MTVRCPAPTPRRLAELPRELPMLHLARGDVLHRVHDVDVACDTFLASDADPCSARDGGRFDPLPQAIAVAVLYAASSAEAALGETLVHVDPRGALRPDGVREAPHRAISRLRVHRPLHLVAFCGLDLHRFPLRHRDLAECGKQDYPVTRAWALAFRRRWREAQGIAWVSRQDNTSLSFVFWGDRLREDDLEPLGRAVALGSGRGAAMVRTVLARMGVRPRRGR